MFRFTIRDVLWLTALVAVSIVLWQSRTQLRVEREGRAKAVRVGQEVLYKAMVEHLKKRSGDVNLDRINGWHNRLEKTDKPRGIDPGIVTGLPTPDPPLPMPDL